MSAAVRLRLLGRTADETAGLQRLLDLDAHVALPFWTRMGFTPTGAAKPHPYAQVEGTIAILVKALVHRALRRFPALEQRSRT